MLGVLHFPELQPVFEGFKIEKVFPQTLKNGFVKTFFRMFIHPHHLLEEIRNGLRIF
jgi:hypothetical protein